MKTLTVIRIGASLMALAAIGPACVAEDEGSLYIENIKGLSADGCEVDDSDDRFLGRGIVDLAVRNSYVLFPRVVNALKDVREIKGFTTGDARLATTDVQLRSAKIRFSTQDQVSVEFPSETTVPLSGTVTLDGGHTTLGVEVLPPSLVERIRNSKEFLIIGATGEVQAARTSVNLIVGLTVVGETLDGRELETPEFFFNVNVCNGCLVNFPPDAVDPSTGRLNCLAIQLDADGNSNIELPECTGGLGRDGVGVDCRICATFAPDPLARQLCQPAL